uniref:Uncharacterized protein n=1 Tax=OCS116 cluster bacterium TaxID=2030921 RepID=A0A2A4Z170_9PROT
MIRDFRNEWPVLFSFVLAILVVFFIWLYGFFIGAEPQYTWLRVCYGTAAILVFTDVIETTYIAWEKSTYKNLDFWMFAFYMGYFFSILMVVLFSRDVDDVVKVVIPQMVGGVVFGIVMAFFTKREKNQAIWQKYDLNKAITNTKKGHLFYYSMPLVNVLMLGVFMVFSPDDAFASRYILWFSIVIGSANPLYPIKKANSNWSWQHIKLSTPKSIGTLLLVYGLLAID